MQQRRVESMTGVSVACISKLSRGDRCNTATGTEEDMRAASCKAEWRLDGGDIEEEKKLQTVQGRENGFVVRQAK